jgi:uncharacterized phage-like protein YoqJ
MRVIITGHREEKLATYDKKWIASTISASLEAASLFEGVSVAYSGMASGVDLWFCESCCKQNIPYIACVPFEEQDEYMTIETKQLRKKYLNTAKEIKKVKNSWMVEHCDYAIVVFDGNKGGTHNVFQQLIEKNIPFTWINPVGKKVWLCH